MLKISRAPGVQLSDLFRLALLAMPVLALVLLWAGFLALSLTVPELLEGHPTSLSAYMAPAPASGPMMEEYGPPAAAGEPMYFPWISVTILSISMGLYLLTAWRYARNYRLTRMPLHATVVAGVIMLAESQLSFFLASTWRISWWEYHALVLLGFTTILYGLLTGYRQGAGLTQTITSLILDGSVRGLGRGYSGVLIALVAAVGSRH